ncbi:MAG TPA: DUF2934 domain-containing protein [Dongiaceae bacterium]|nr:DUF2934 domain-containing protein [Dongiaceae bacterium]
MPKKTEASNTATAAKTRKSRAAKTAPTHEQISLRAYHIYLQRNGAPGNPFDDWKQAEQQLLSEAAVAKPRRKGKVVSIAA